MCIWKNELYNDHFDILLMKYREPLKDLLLISTRTVLTELTHGQLVYVIRDVRTKASPFVAKGRIFLYRFY